MYNANCYNWLHTVYYDDEIYSFIISKIYITEISYNIQKKYFPPLHNSQLIVMDETRKSNMSEKQDDGNNKEKITKILIKEDNDKKSNNK